MKYILIEQKTIITFHAKHGAGLFESLTEAKKFINDHDLEECDVIIDGFCFNIEKYSDIVEKIKEYKEGMMENEAD